MTTGGLTRSEGPGGTAVARGRERVPAFRGLLGAIAAAAVAVRLAAVWWLPDTEPWLPFGGDGWVYLNNATALANGEWFVDSLVPQHSPDAMHPPLWTLVLGGVIRAGVSSPGHLAIFASMIGVVTVVLVGLLARRVAGDRAGLVAAGIAALYPGFWLYERNLNAETLVFPLIALCLLATYRLLDRRTLGSAALLGLAVGLTASTRAEQALLGVLLVLPVVVTRSMSVRRGLAIVGTVLGVVVLVAAPWTLFNLGRFERPVLLSTGSGNAMIVGACERPFYGDVLGGYDVDCLFRSRWVLEQDDSVRSAQQVGESLTYERENLGRLPVVVLAREGRSLGFYGVAQQVELNRGNLDVVAPAAWAQQVAYWLLLPLAVVGAVAIRRWRVLLPLLMPAVVVVASTAVTFGDSRYRAPLEVPLVVLAATGVVAAVDAVRRRGARPAPVATEPAEVGETAAR